MKKMAFLTSKVFSILIILALGGFQRHANAADTKFNCYRFAMQNPANETAAKDNIETWCYKHEHETLYIFNADHGAIRPELALLVKQDGTITHGSLAAGIFSIHSIAPGQFNPFSVPLTEPVSVPVRVEDERNNLIQHADNLFIQLSESVSTKTHLNVAQGKFVARATTLPWRGFWWPYLGQPLSGIKNSPMGKYDSFVSIHSGSSPGSANWENKNHKFENIFWEGHCNGWASSSILRAEPKFTRSDAQSGVSFSVSDIKGLLAEKDYCSNIAFFGNRYSGSGGDRSDIYPALFHKTLLYYLGSLGKPVVMDHDSGSPVDNQVISGYTMNIKQDSPGRVTVAANLTIHRYDSSQSNSPGNAPSYTHTYRYTLDLDASGNPSDGHWLSDNPDFLWVPLSPSNCASNNPNINETWIETIMQLPIVP